MNKSEMLSFIKKTSFIPSKKMGQNFLFCNEYQNKIVNSLSESKNVLEIGPGLGALTDLLSKKNLNLKIVELDKRIVEFIKTKHSNIEVINDNFLNIDLDYMFNGEDFNIISNLPYSISSNAIVKIIKSEKVNESIILIQKEVADRILSKLGDEKYNSFSILIQTLSKPEKLFDIPSSVFYPEPKVVSTLIRINNIKNVNLNKDKYEKFLRMCFSQKRKTIFNNLKNYFSNERILNILKAHNIDKSIRPEKISIDQYISLFKGFYEE